MREKSFERIRAAYKKDWFSDELVPIPLGAGKAVKEDESFGKPDLSKLEKLQPSFTKTGTVTAGNASSISDGMCCTVR